MSKFEVISTNQLARRAVLLTASGEIQTPVFMPIATVGSIKTLLAEEVKALGAQIILGNTYHLLLRPGLELLRELGGIKPMMRWDGPMLTDSGGYQVFSLARLNSIQESGVTFNSHIDGRSFELTPESSMDIQAAIGSDIRMQFDDVAAGISSRARYEEAMLRSLRWAERSKLAHENKDTSQLFGIIQGGTHEDLRDQSLAGLKSLGFDGYAIGGLSVGESRTDTFRIAKHIALQMPADRPRYFMGGGMPEEIVFYVSVGIDMFDCVLPTRNARHGQLFVWAGEPSECVREALARAQAGESDVRIAEVLYRKIQITNEQFTSDMSVIDEFNDTDTSQTYSKAYLRHLFKAGEVLGMRLATAQNLRFYMRLMEELRRCLH
ncbi:MAG: tRNA guanosine(34) transglycosylase Tgt [Patescibacteria group bacterium]